MCTFYDETITYVDFYSAYKYLVLCQCLFESFCASGGLLLNSFFFFIFRGNRTVF
jgi:hypothetical protein